jgi:hypothetical protein
MRKVVLAVGALAIAAAIAAFFFVTHQRRIATDPRVPIPTPLAS